MFNDWVYDVLWSRVIDGDTVEAIVDLGFGVRRKDKFRLYGIDTPERGHSGWLEATERLKELIVNTQMLCVQTIKDKSDKYGRYLAILIDGSTGRSLNDVMVAEGHAVNRKY
jgi:micrococcal nuclease